jgi:hypothetical protein
VSTTDSIALILHLVATAAVGADGFAAYEQRHQTLTSYVVGPPMAIEGVTALWLFFDPPATVGRLWPLIGLAVLGIVHASTVFLQVPQHTALTNGFDAARARRLVRTNWIRTVGWSARGLIAALLVGNALTA